MPRQRLFSGDNDRVLAKRDSKAATAGSTSIMSRFVACSDGRISG
jgi:hypothetical protein